MTPEQFQSNLTVRPEVIGTTAVLIHFLPNTSSQRGTMVNNMSQQIEVIEGCETSRVQTGFEPKYAKYEFDAAERDQNVQVQKVIPKFGLSTINDKIRHNPSYTVIYSGEEDGKIGYFMIDDWTQLHSGFGYRNKKVFRSYPSEGDYIPKEMKFTTAPDHDGNMYNLGLNANVCYMPMWETTEDAFVISESLAQRFTHTVIDKRVVNINPDVCPLNLYGDELNYRSFPDIGDTVREDGILIALRRHDPNSFLMDMSDAELSVPRHLHDDLIMAPPGAQVVDVQVFINHRVVRNCTQSCYGQLMEYQQLHYNYYNSVIQAYDELAAQGYEFRPEFVTLVTRCKCFTYSGVGKLMILMDKKDRIENIRLEVTYAYPQKIAQGYKITGLDGSKGVVSAVWKDEDMPVSQHGVRADVLITAASPFNRMNCGQFYEQFITLCSSIVADRVRREIPPDKAYDYIMDYIQEINPNFAQMIAEDLNTQALRDDFVEACKEDGIYLVVPPFCNSINPELILRLSKKYGIERGPISYYRTHSDGTREHIVTKHDGLIGSKYMVLLGKRPGDALAATELGYVNQFSTPMKANGKWAKMQCLHSQTPQKYGEDEMGNLIVILGVIAAARISGVYSNSTVALNALAEKLLTDPHPSALKNNGMTTAEVVKTCSNIGLFQHMLAAIGYTIKENP